VSDPCVTPSGLNLKLNKFITNPIESCAALGWARETHGLVEAPSQVPHVVASWVHAPRCRVSAEDGTLLRARPHAVTRELQLIGFNLDSEAVQLGVSLSWGAAAQDREKWRKLAARLGLLYCCRQRKLRNRHLRTNADGTDSA
jgi:hypothetical protein